MSYKQHTTSTTFSFRLLIVGLLLLQGFVSPAFSQDIDITPNKRRGEQISSSDTIISYQLRKLQQYSAEVNGISSWIRRGVDTGNLREGIETLAQRLIIARKGVLEYRNTYDNLISLKSSMVIIESINRQLEQWQKQVSEYSLKTYEAQILLNALRQDTLMQMIPDDKSLAKEYFSRIKDVSEKAKPASQQITKLAIDLSLLQNRLVELQLESADDINELRFRIKKVGSELTRHEVPYLWKEFVPNYSFEEMESFSRKKGIFTFLTYLGLSSAQNAWLVFAFLVIYLLLRIGIGALEKNNQEQELSLTTTIRRTTLLVSLFIAFSFGQFFYNNPPMIFLQLFWGVMVLSGTVIFWKQMTRTVRILWVTGIVLFICSGIVNLMLLITVTERWLTFLLAMVGLAASLYAHFYFKKPGNTTMPLIRVLVILFMVQQSISIFANVFGRYGLAKIMMTGGYFNLVLAITLWWLVILLMEVLYLLLDAIRNRDNLSPYFNFEKIKTSTRPFLQTIVIILWSVIFVKNLHLYELIVETGEEILLKERSIGSFVYSYSGILIFITIILIATLLAKIVSYVMANDQQEGRAGMRKRFGGVVLIARLAILTFGFLIAIAAAGIPLDKITIIIGALGVGIGFGLQNIVSNLVSGVIIAFERPINVGDQIEVGGRLGRVMEIGIRSSKIATFEGAEVIIPNGDLLNQHLVNWTLSSNNIRIEIKVGVKYGTDLEKARLLLEEVITNQENVLSVPAPAILLNEFGGSSINFRLLFWTGDISAWLQLKSSVIEQIDKTFKVNGIEIPFPQQDIYVKEMPESMRRKKEQTLPDVEASKEETQDKLDAPQAKQPTEKLSFRHEEQPKDAKGSTENDGATDQVQ